MRQSTFFPFVCVLVLVFDPFHSAWAYLDPGTGSMILQLLLGGIAGVAMILKLYWHRLITFFKGKPTNTPPDQSSKGDE